MKVRITGDGPPQELEVGGGLVTIGRDPRNSVILACPTVSAFHLEIRIEPRGLVARDLGSSNGTVVEGRSSRREILKAHEAYILKDDDELLLGSRDAPVRVIARLTATDVTAPAHRDTIRASRPVAGRDPISYRIMREGLGAGDSGPMLLGDSAPMRVLRETITKVARSGLPVLITGETGTGKELVAKRIHWESPRRGRPFVAFNVAAIASSLVEAEMFGARKGAFTGASTDRPGLFEAADTGTIFMDEVGELSPEAQAALLRVIEAGEVRRAGDTRVRKVDVRVVSATNRDLDSEAAGGAFRRDLLFRLNPVVIECPPLRERREDIPLLCDHFLALACRQHDRPLPEFAPEARVALASREWPGNVRQLANEIARAVVLLPRGRALTARDFSHGHESAGGNNPTGSSDLREVMAAREKEHVKAVLDAHDGNRTQAARTLGLTRAGLQKIIRRHGL